MKPASRVYLASSVAEGFDLIETVELAERHGFDGVQLYLSEPFLSERYFNRLLRVIKRAGVGVMVHLPDVYTSILDGPVKRLLAETQPRKALIHYRDGMAIPAIKGIKTGLENAVFGYEREYYDRLLETARGGGYFWAFDVPRIFGEIPGDRGKIHRFLVHLFDRLGSDDVLHLIDQVDFGRDRELWCPFGEGLLAPYMEYILKFRGPIVLEYEDIDMALRSRDVLLS